MLTYIVRRLIGIIPLLLGITIISFAVINLVPGKPTTQEELMSPRISYEARARLEKLYELDKPIHIRYIRWLGRVVRLDLGNSWVDGRPVVKKIMERIPITLTINILSLGLILIISIPLVVRTRIMPHSD